MWRLSEMLLAGALVASAQVTALQNVTIIDGTGAAPLDKGTIVIANGKIRDIGVSSSLKVPMHAQVVNLKGKTIIPGIINLHGHVGMVKGLNQSMANYTHENVDGISFTE